MGNYELLYGVCILQEREEAGFLFLVVCFTQAETKSNNLRSKHAANVVCMMQHDQRLHILLQSNYNKIVIVETGSCDQK